MSGEWPVLTLQDVCQKITDGAHSSPSDCADGYPMASVKDLHSWGLDLTTARTIAKSDYDLLVANGCKPIKGDVLIAKDGATCLDTVCVHKHDQDVVLLSSVAILRPSSKLDSGFLRYYLDAPSTRAMLKSGYVSGSAIPRVVLKDFRRAPIPLPPLPEQRRIAKILGDLDDKIELNRKMNETLEQMARALFKSWFVDFDPVRAKMEGRTPTGMDAATAALFPDRLVDSELGPIPEGWEVKALGDSVTLISGGTPKTVVEEYWNGDIPWFSVKDVPSEGDVWVTTTEKSITPQGLRNSATQILPKGTTIVTARGTVGKLALVGTPMAMNQSCYGVRSRNGICHYFIYFLMREAVVKLQQNTHGSVFETITRQTFDSLSCVMPSEAILEKFESAVEPYLESIHINIHQSRTLSTLRDTLLPKLVGGEVRVVTDDSQ